MWIAIEAFFDDQPGPHDVAALLGRFDEFLSELGTQPVTITLSSLIADMVEAYHRMPIRTQSPRRTAEDLEKFAEHFVLSRDIFFYPSNRAPIVEATFLQSATGNYGHGNGLDVQVHYSWAPPLLNFHGLRNVVSEGDHFTLQPSALNTKVLNSISPYTAEYFVGPGNGADGSWLAWDSESQSLRGVVPTSWAEREGAGRLDAYTIPLEVVAVVTKWFDDAPGGGGPIRLERVIRCAVPLTVKRRPDICAGAAEMVGSPPLEGMGVKLSPRKMEKSPLRLAKNERNVRLSAGSHCHRTQSANDLRAALKTASFRKPSFTRTQSTYDLRCQQKHSYQESPCPPYRPSATYPLPLRPASVLRTFAIRPRQDKENHCADSISYKDIDRALKWKAEEGYTPIARGPTTPPGMQMNPLSLASLYEGISRAEQSRVSPAGSSPAGTIRTRGFAAPVARAPIPPAHGAQRLNDGLDTYMIGSEELPSFCSEL